MKTVHALWGGLPLCGFMPGTVPGDWPAGHVWTNPQDLTALKADDSAKPCEKCLEEARKRVSTR
jgi:hypothetical protein